MKKILLFALPLILFFIPKDIFAKNINMAPSDIYVNFQTGSPGHVNPVPAYEFQLNTYYGYSTSPRVSQNTVVYQNFPDDISKTYDIHFQMAVTNNFANFGLPAVSIDNHVCSVSSGNMTGVVNGNSSWSPNNSYQSIFLIRCDGVQLTDKSFSIRTYHSIPKSDDTPTFFGISRNWIVNENSSSSLGNSIKEQTEETKKQTDTIKDSDTSESSSQAGDFFNNFDSGDDYGLADIITMPLEFINKIKWGSCSPLKLPLPFVNKEIQLPCMYQIYNKYFRSFLTIYQTIIFGIISYHVCINIMATVRGFKNPDRDEIEVLDL